MAIKYVVYRDQDRYEKFIIFDNLTNHSDHRDIGKILGAGFIRLTTQKDEVKYECYGESTSLGIPSRNELDSKIINSYERT